MTNPDIVEVIKARLEGCRCHRFSTGNRCGGCEHDARCLAEIERMREENEEWKIEADRLADMLENEDKLIQQREQFRRERDEARRLACRGLALETYHAAQFIGAPCALTADEIALERGWDCFKERAEVGA